ncbi:MAG TPA: hypothetical protein VHL08_06980 [Dongiaceae bacterium]|jgi:hypothetical protein|nr:hypothetical protein [Dongiaceae bacterium]
MKRTVLAILLGILPAACHTPPARETFPELTYSHLPPIGINVAHINIIDMHPRTSESSHIEGQFPRVPAEVMQRWAMDRLRATGQYGFGTFTILRAEAVDVPLSRTEGVQGWFTKDQSDRYDLTLVAKLEVNNPAIGHSAAATAQVTRSQTVAEDATLNDREAVWFHMTEDAMKALDQEMTRQINANLGAFLTR